MKTNTIGKTCWEASKKETINPQFEDLRTTVAEDADFIVLRIYKKHAETIITTPSTKISIEITKII